MKKRLLCFITMLSLMFGSLGQVTAESFNVSASSSVAPGKTFNVSVSLNGEGKFSAAVENGSGGGTKWIDKSGSFSITAGSSGTTIVTITAIDATSFGEEEITGSQTVSVSIEKPVVSKPSSSSSSSSSSKPSTSTPSTSNPSNSKPIDEDKRSKDNTLSSLSISKGQLSPQFSSSNTSYKVSLTSDVESVDISAKVHDSKASVKGVGTKSLSIGTQTYAITVYAENGQKKVYSITFDVIEKPNLFVNIENTKNKVGLLKDTSKASVPSGFKETQVAIDQYKVNGWTNENGQITLAYLIDEEDNKNLYLVEEGKVISKCQLLSMNGKTYYIANGFMKDESKGLESKTVKINDLQLEGWQYPGEKHKAYSLLYLMNDNGEKNFYSYEETEQTLQKYIAEESNNNDTLVYCFIAATVVFAGLSLFLTIRHIRYKKKSISAIKDYYASKANQEE